MSDEQQTANTDPSSSASTVPSSSTASTVSPASSAPSLPSSTPQVEPKDRVYSDDWMTRCAQVRENFGDLNLTNLQHNVWYHYPNVVTYYADKTIVPDPNDDLGVIAINNGISVGILAGYNGLSVREWMYKENYGIRKGQLLYIPNDPIAAKVTMKGS